MVETNRPFLYAVSHRLGSVSKLFHRDTSVTVTLINKNFVETHGAYDREPFGKKTCTTEIQLRNLLCPELPNLSPGGRGRVSLFSPPRANKVGPSWRPCHVIHTSNFFTHSTFFGTSLPLKLDFLLFLTRTCVE